MAKYKIIGNMTGNSMDAVDLVLTEFDGNKITDLCTFSKPYSKPFRQKMENLRQQVLGKSKTEISQIPEFGKIHHAYVQDIAQSINRMCQLNGIDKKSITAIGFHGKTLDHFPPSVAHHQKPYTLQIGSGQMLADLTQIPVCYDFRSDLIMHGFEGAPLIATHNAHIAKLEGDGIYYNGGNTSNFAVIEKNQPVFATDSGPFNEYVDAFMRQKFGRSFDKNGAIGQKGKLNEALFKKVFELGQDFYQAPQPKSGDPAFYKTKEVLSLAQNSEISPEDAVYTLEYFAAYIAFLALAQAQKNIRLPDRVILFGGGWKNPLTKKCFENFFLEQTFILPEHRLMFKNLRTALQNACVRYSRFGTYMEARLMADLARYKLENKPWQMCEENFLVLGRVARPMAQKKHYEDCLSLAAKGW